jgi:hypothetical protein
MSKKDDSILFGAKRAGITWLFKFHERSSFNRVQAGVKRLGMSLAEFLCRQFPALTGAPALPDEPRKFTEEDGETARLKVQLVECDEFTRACLERQAKNNRESVEEYINRAIFFLRRGRPEPLHASQHARAGLQSRQGRATVQVRVLQAHQTDSARNHR